MAEKPSRSFIRRAVAEADLDAVRMAIYQLTGDEALGALPLASRLDAAQRELLIETATDWLTANAGPRQLPQPEDAELRRLMALATGGPVGDREFEARHELTSFRPFPYTKDWGDDRPEIPTDFNAVIIGSGFAGLTMAVQLDLLGIRYTILERRHEAGGVWSINRYPEVRVDTMSVTYDMAFEREHSWQEYFGRGEQLREYLGYISRKYGIHDRTRFDHDMKQARFDEARDLWVLDIETPGGPIAMETNVLISCSGLFATPNVPEFAGREDFRGRIVHTAQWPEDVDLVGKRVATVGNGSTGVQMLNAVARQAVQVHHFQRTPQWIMPRDRYGQAVSAEVQWLTKNLPGYANWVRFTATMPLFDTHDLMKPDPAWIARGGKVSEANDTIRADLTAYIHGQIGDRDDLFEQLVPDYAPFARRPVVDNGFYQALTRENVELVSEPIERLVPEGILTSDGAVREVDLIITATGYQVVKYLWPTRYLGRGGVDLHRRWDEGDGPRAYIGLMMPDFPNFFTLYGPNSQPISGGPQQPTWFATWAGYVALALMGMLRQHRSRVEVKQAAFDRYNAELDAAADELLVMSAAGAREKNYYLAGGKRLAVNAPWYSPDYYRMCSQIEWDDLMLSGELSTTNLSAA